MKKPSYKVFKTTIYGVIDWDFKSITKAMEFYKRLADPKPKNTSVQMVKVWYYIGGAYDYDTMAEYPNLLSRILPNTI